MTALTPEVLQKVAERLGYYAIAQQSDGARILWQDGGGFEVRSDGDLLLAILNKAAEMGHTMTVELSGSLDGTRTTSFANIRNPGAGVRSCHGTTALEAAMLAFAQLPLEGGNG